MPIGKLFHRAYQKYSEGNAAWEAETSGPNATWHIIGCCLQSSQFRNTCHFLWSWLAVPPRSEMRKAVDVCEIQVFLGGCGSLAMQTQRILCIVGV